MFSYTVAKEMLGMSLRTNRELTLKSVLSRRYTRQVRQYRWCIVMRRKNRRGVATPKFDISVH
jgi:hypothetical protein